MRKPIKDILEYYGEMSSADGILMARDKYLGIKQLQFVSVRDGQFFCYYLNGRRGEIYDKAPLSWSDKPIKIRP